MTRPLRQRTFEWRDPTLFAREIGKTDGRSLLERVVAGEFEAPIQSTLGMRFDAVGDGTARWSLEPAEFLYNPGGTVQGGVLSALLDSAMATAIWSTLPAGAGWTTLELKVNLVRAATAASGRLIAEAKAIHVGRTTGTAEGRIVDADGRLYSHGTTTCMIFPGALPAAETGARRSDTAATPA